MNNPKLFILLLFVLSAILFFVNLPSPVAINIQTPKIPLLGKSIEVKNVNIDFSSLDIDLGFARIEKKFDYRLGLDLQGGTKITYKVDMSKIPSDQKESAFESARNIIDRRINFFGVVEPSIQTLKISGDYRIIVELPGVSDVNEAINLIGKTAQLSFWEEGATGSGILKDATVSANLPFGMTEVLGDSPILTDLTGKDLKSSKVVFNQSGTGGPAVQLNFSPEGVNKFADITKRNVGKPVVIVLDNEIISYPRVENPILNGDAIISGGFTVDQAKSLSIALNSGALPAPLEIISQSNVGPSLGIESLKKSLFAGVLGFISIVAFMILLYKKEGYLASLALIMYIIITLFIFKLIPVTLTLAGIAGFILSIGMAVDANILIFERMKEEKRAGRPKDIAIEIGFKRAWTSIRDSNISSLITCFVLFYFGTGIVRGFALTLAIGILASMFSAITITRNLLRVFDKEDISGVKSRNNNELLRIFKRTKPIDGNT